MWLRHFSALAKLNQGEDTRHKIPRPLISAFAYLKMKKLYTQRKRPPRRELIYQFDEALRKRLLAVFKDYISGSFSEFLHSLGQDLIKSYGYLKRSTFEAVKASDIPVLEHFIRSENEEVLDFFEAAIRNPQYIGEQEGVNALNSVLQEEGIGYRFSEFSFETSKSLFGLKRKSIYSFSEAHRINDEHVYQTVVRPALQFISNTEFKISHNELMKALAACRQNEPEDAITLAGAAYESFLKTVLKIRSCSFDPDKDTCSRLVRIIIDNDMLPSFYESCFISPATIRNKLGDAHGRGPEKSYEPNTDQASHMINLVCANMLLLRKCAEL